MLCLYLYMRQKQMLQWFWCHTCQYRFPSDLQAGVDEICCPRCKNYFCQRCSGTWRPQEFSPYQKPPKQKTRTLPRVNAATIRLALFQLTAQEDLEPTRQVPSHLLQSLRTTIEQAVDDCIICKEEIALGSEALKCPCAHIFHQECLEEWLKYKNSCPKCRQSILPQ